MTAHLSLRIVYVHPIAVTPIVQTPYSILRLLGRWSTKGMIWHRCISNNRLAIVTESCCVALTSRTQQFSDVDRELTSPFIRIEQSGTTSHPRAHPAAVLRRPQALESGRWSVSIESRWWWRCICSLRWSKTRRHGTWCRWLALLEVLLSQSSAEARRMPWHVRGKPWRTVSTCAAYIRRRDVVLSLVLLLLLLVVQ